MSSETIDQGRRMAEEELTAQLLGRNIFVYTMVGAVGFIAASAWIVLG